MFKKISHLVISCAATVVFSFNDSYALELKDALESAYKNNPVLKSTQEEFKKLVERFPQTLATEFLPSINAEITDSEIKERGERQAVNPTGAYKESLSIRQNLFSGGSSSANLAATKFLVSSFKDRYILNEQNFLLQAIKVYMDAYEAVQLVKMQASNIEFYKKTLEATKEKQKLGHATKTEVAIAFADYANAVSNQSSYNANQISANMRFKQFFAIEPKDLKMPPIKQLASFEEFRKRAQKYNPEISLSKAEMKSKKYGIHASFARLLPSLDFDVSFSNSSRKFANSANGDFSKDTTSTLRLTVPILNQGGVEYSRMRQARADYRQSALVLEDKINETEAKIHNVWHSFVAAQERKSAYSDIVSSRKVALDGIKQEELLGSKSLNDVLKAKVDLSEAETRNIQSNKDYIIKYYEILATEGSLTAKKLKLNVVAFNPEKEFQKIKFRLIPF